MWVIIKEGKEVPIDKRVRGRSVSYEGPCMWGEEHPFGWDRMDQAVGDLFNLFSAEGWIGGEHQEGGTFILDIKEKFGTIRIYSFLNPEDREKFFDTLEVVMDKYPGLAGWLDPDEVEEEIEIGPEEGRKNNEVCIPKKLTNPKTDKENEI